MEKKAAIVCVEDMNGCILLLQRAKKDRVQGWGLPGGKIDEGESPMQAAERELLEETGIVARGHLVNVGDSRSAAGWELVVFHLRMPFEGLSYDIKLQPEEHSAYRWMSFREPDVLDMQFAGNTLLFILRALRRK